MIEVRIYINERCTIPMFVFKSSDPKEKVLERIFSYKAYCYEDEVENKTIAINTDKILFVEVVDLKVKEKED